MASNHARRDYNLMRAKDLRGAVCHAPSVNLNFEQTGKVTACCYNRRFILGSYPKDSLSEIWNGSRIAELRAHMKAADLSHGCQLCEHQMNARNFSGLHATHFDRYARLNQDRSAEPVPRVMEFEISNACNLECVMCNGYFSSSIRRNREKLEPLPQIYDEAFVEQLRPFLPDLVDMKFLGGEPFLNPLYYKIWDLILEVNPKINAVITTNATILSPKALKMLERLKPTVVVSCDSLDKKTYEQIRKNAQFDVFEKNLGSLLKVAEVAQKALSITICPMTNNWKTIPDILRFCNRNKVCLGANTVVWPKEFSMKYLPKAKIRQIHRFLAQECSPELQTSSLWWEQHNFQVYQGMLNQIEMWSKENDGWRN